MHRAVLPVKQLNAWGKYIYIGRRSNLDFNLWSADSYNFRLLFDLFLYLLVELTASLA
jgi:hypothetical protein